MAVNHRIPQGAQTGDSAGNKTIRVTSTGSLFEGITFDAISASYPNNTTEVYEYYLGGLAGVLQATVTVVYTSASKNEISTVERT
jgi:hypothetical protein